MTVSRRTLFPYFLQHSDHQHSKFMELQDTGRDVFRQDYGGERRATVSTISCDSQAGGRPHLSCPSVPRADERDLRDAGA